MYESIPNELKGLKQWVCWKGVPDENKLGKLKKIPINPYTLGQAQSNNPETWSDFETALKSSEKVSGIGFMFSNSPYFGIDIDNISEDIEKYKNGEKDNILGEFIDSLQTYSEYSVSGNGIHLICKGNLPPQGRRKLNVEMYESGRYFIMTGNSAAEYKEIKDCTETVKRLHEKYIGGGQTPSIVVNTPALTINEDMVIELAKRSKQRQIFLDLYNGNWQCYFTSQSEADLSFCNMLAFWCRKDEALMDRIYRSSGLMRAKWNRRQNGSTYGKMILSKAIRECQNVYEPPKNYKINIKESERKEERKKYSFDDTGNAERFTDMFGEVVRYSYLNKKWLYYDGRRWCFDYTGAIRRMADEIVNTMINDLGIYLESAEDEEEAKKLFLRHVKTSRSNRSKTAMIKESEHKVSILPSQMDTYKTLFNTPNGLINLRNGSLSPHDEKKYITKISYIEYTEDADCPEWMKFLDSIFNNDKELINYVQKAIGYSLTGSTQEQCVFICYGTGRNGKTTFIDIIAEMMGDYAINIQPESIMIRNYNNSANSDIARLKSARFVTSVEPNEGMRLNEGLMKQLTGGDKVTARKLFEDEFEFKPEFKLWLATNHKPIIRGTDLGIWRRLHLIPFTVEIPEDKVDKNLKFKLKSELKGILKWAIEGCLLWQKEGLKLPQAVMQATKEYRNEMDVISTFLEECTEVNNSSIAKAAKIYEVYKKWSRDNNEYEMSSRKFGIEMCKRFEKTHKRDGWYYKGIDILSSYKSYAVNIG